MTLRPLMVANPRYDGKPLLKLLECYVLNVIGELPERERDRLNAMAPKLHDLYGGPGRWDEAVAAAVHMSADMPAAIKAMWAKNSEIARANHVSLTPQTFAEMFVDHNLVA